MLQTEPVRILNLFTIMNRGGAETMVMNYYRKIDRTKIQFDFVVHRQERGAYDDEIESLGGRIYRMSPIRPWNAWEYRKKLRKFYLEHEEYRIIHSHMSELGYYGFIEAERVGIPFRICHAHNRPNQIDAKSCIRWYYKKRMKPYITHMFVCGEEAGIWLYGRKNISRFIMMNNAVDTKKYRYNEEKRLEVRKRLGIEQKIVIGHVGRFNMQKNHTFIIDIFAELLINHPDAVLMLIGDEKSEDGKKIREKVNRIGINQSVLFMGVREDVPDLLQAMDVFLFPSLFEGVSVACIEAQSAGVPCVISDTIPIECKKTDLVRICSLKDSTKKWSEVVFEETKKGHVDTFIEMKKAGFDISENAMWLQNYYLNLVNGDNI